MVSCLCSEFLALQIEVEVQRSLECFQFWAAYLAPRLKVLETCLSHQFLLGKCLPGLALFLSRAP